MEDPETPLSPRHSDSNSPEFEFCPSLPPPTLLSAAELFSGGILLPLRHLNLNNNDPDDSDPTDLGTPVSDPEPGPEITRVSSSESARSKRWKDLFKKSSSEKERKGERPSQLGPSHGTELNINIWPFSRSRSAGNCGTRPRMPSGGGRKASSAPCSRSNSASESKSRKWPSSPGRAGVVLGRSSPVWQVRPNGPNHKAPTRRHKAAIAATAGAKARVLDLNVSTCIGYRNCRSNENCATRAGGGSGGGGAFFNIRNMFSKKVY